MYLYTIRYGIHSTNGIINKLGATVNTVSPFKLNMTSKIVIFINF